MQPETQKPRHQEQCHSEEERAHQLIELGQKLQADGHRLAEDGEKLILEGKQTEEEGKRLLHDCEERKDKELYIFVNRQKFDRHQGVKKEMTPDEIARLVDLTIETAVVRRILAGGDTSDPLVEIQKIKAGDQFAVTRKKVEGGCQERIEKELSLLREGSQEVEFVKDPIPCVIYKNLWSTFLKEKIDVIVQVPAGYPSAMIDRAGVLDGSRVIPTLKGSPQEIVQVAGKSWKLISYHPHNGGGGLPWNPSRHGFHTYLYEVLSWLEVTR